MQNEALSEITRRERENLGRLRTALENKRLMLVVGAGVTLSATRKVSGEALPRLTWTGLIRNGLDYLVASRYVDASAGRTKRAFDALEDPDPGSLLEAANFMADRMKHNRQFPTWLESVFGNLHQEVRYPSLLNVLRVLHQKGAMLLTTNYDDLLEEACNLRRIGRSNHEYTSSKAIWLRQMALLLGRYAPGAARLSTEIENRPSPVYTPILSYITKHTLSGVSEKVVIQRRKGEQPEIIHGRFRR